MAIYIFSELVVGLFVTGFMLVVSAFYIDPPKRRRLPKQLDFDLEAPSSRAATAPSPSPPLSSPAPSHAPSPAPAPTLTPHAPSPARSPPLSSPTPSSPMNLEDNTPASAKSVAPVVAKKKKKPKKRTAEERALLKKAKREKQRAREDEELRLLKQETERFRKEAEEKRRVQEEARQKELLEREAAIAAEKKRLEDIAAAKQKAEEEEEERLREIARKKQEANAARLEALKPKPKKAWGNVASKAAKTTPLSFAEILKKQTRSDGTGEDEDRRLRADRRRHRQIVLEKRAREKALQASEDKTQVDKEASAGAQEESKQFAWVDTTKFTMDQRGVGTISGIPSESKAFLIGEHGRTINVLKELNVRVKLLEDGTARVEGYHEDVELAYMKIKHCLTWHYFANAVATHTKKMHRLKDKSSLKARVATKVLDWLKMRVLEFTFRYHNEAFGLGKLNLASLPDDIALVRVNKRLATLERLPTSGLPASRTLEIQLPFSRSKTATPLEKQIIATLTDFHFTYAPQHARSCRALVVRL